MLNKVSGFGFIFITTQRWRVTLVGGILFYAYSIFSYIGDIAEEIIVMKCVCLFLSVQPQKRSLFFAHATCCDQSGSGKIWKPEDVLQKVSHTTAWMVPSCMPIQGDQESSLLFRLMVLLLTTNVKKSCCFTDGDTIPTLVFEEWLE